MFLPLAKRLNHTGFNHTATGLLSLQIKAWHHPLSKEMHMDRKERLLFLFDATGIGLEIGPSFNPLLPKRDGYDVETLDHLSAADLREKYKNAPNVDLSAIEEVDHLSDGSSILQLIGKPEHYDYIVASHVIEHTTACPRLEQAAPWIE